MPLSASISSTSRKLRVNLAYSQIEWRMISGGKRLNEAGEELAREPSRYADGRRAYASLRWSLCMTEWPAA